MIDIGIQNHGIEYTVPEKITAEDLEYSMLFMTENEKNEWTSCFTENGNKILTRNVAEDKLQAVSEKFQIPLALTYQMSNVSEDSFRTMLAEYSRSSSQISDSSSISLEEASKLFGTELKIRQVEDENGKTTSYADLRPIMLGLFQNGQIDNTKLSDMRSNMEETVSALGERTVKSMGIAYAADADKKAGINIDSVQK